MIRSVEASWTFPMFDYIFTNTDLDVDHRLVDVRPRKDFIYMGVGINERERERVPIPRGPFQQVSMQASFPSS